MWLEVFRLKWLYDMRVVMIYILFPGVLSLYAFISSYKNSAAFFLSTWVYMFFNMTAAGVTLSDS